MENIIDKWHGHCPVCKKNIEFKTKSNWHRDDLRCPNCDSLPRERGLAHVINLVLSGQMKGTVHESSPSEREIDRYIESLADKYIPSHFYPSTPRGTYNGIYRSEDIQNMTFLDESIDFHVTLDVMEHVFFPDLVFREVARTLKKDGAYIFSVPTYKNLVDSVQLAKLNDKTGEIIHLTDEPEYHGNPISEEGALVTFHYGYDFPELIHKWSGLNTTSFRFVEKYIGVIGEFTEIYICRR